MDATAERTDPIEITADISDPRTDPETTTTLGRSDVHVSRIGVASMTWSSGIDGAG